MEIKLIYYSLQAGTGSTSTARIAAIDWSGDLFLRSIVCSSTTTIFQSHSMLASGNKSHGNYIDRLRPA
jgi:hypothetical protein